MRCLLFLLLGLPLPVYLSAQASTDSTAVDTRYLEDQFYVGLTYNFVLNKPQNVTQRSLSYGLMGGFIKDIPLNPRRNVAIGLGLGYAVYSYYTNLRVTESGTAFQYDILDGNTSFIRNKLETHMIEIPLEFRWRNSTATAYKFWRFYSGVKFGYVVGGRSKFVTNAYKDSFYNTDIQNFRYGLMLNFGYNTFNIHAYYALNHLFKNGISTVDGQNVDFTPLRIGLIFYIL
jgi:hypothetical protein